MEILGEPFFGKIIKPKSKVRYRKVRNAYEPEKENHPRKGSRIDESRLVLIVLNEEDKRRLIHSINLEGTRIDKEKLQKCLYLSDTAIGIYDWNHNFVITFLREKTKGRLQRLRTRFIRFCRKHGIAYKITREHYEGKIPPDYDWIGRIGRGKLGKQLKQQK